jgi:ATP-dependent Clp endopeptidase proteolytic subunit ClpP
MSRSWFSIQNKTETSAEVNIYDEIGLWGITAADFINALRAVGDRRILLRINSPGGDVFHGFAIYTRLRDHKGGVDVKIDGLAASMASVIAMAGDNVAMPSNALMMVHNPSGLVIGESEDMRKLADVLDKVKATLITAYQRKTGKPYDELSSMLDAETWMNPEEALEHGFIDEILDPLPVAASLRPDQLARFAHAPAALTTQTPRMSTVAEPDLTKKHAPKPKTKPDPEPEPEPAPAPEPAPEPSPEPATPPSEPPAEEEVKAILARVGTLNADLITALARVTELETQLNASATEITNLKAQVSTLSKTSELYAGLKKSLGLAPAATVPDIAPAGDLSGDSDDALLNKFERGDAKVRSDLFKNEETKRRLLGLMGRKPASAPEN